MNTNGTNPGMNVEDYENMAVQNSNTAKRVAMGAAVFAGGAAVAGGAAYAATHSQDDVEEQELTTDDVVNGATVGNDYHEVKEQVTQQTTHVVEEKVETPEEPSVVWEDKTIYYDEEGNVVGSMESGTVEGHKFVMLDRDGDNHADVVAIDSDGNGVFDDNEVILVDKSDHVHMGHDTAHTTEVHNNTGYVVIGEGEEGDVAYNQNGEVIHNNFEDEKTGESYTGDYAENNPDYNPHADMNDYGSNNYLAENEAYDEEEDSYAANMDGMPNPEYTDNNDYDSESLTSSADDYMAEAESTESYDDMVGGDEFMG